MGSVQHLKSRFGDGYNIKITVKGPDYNGDITRLIKYMGANLPNANLKVGESGIFEDFGAWSRYLGQVLLITSNSLLRM